MRRVLPFLSLPLPSTHVACQSSSHMMIYAKASEQAGSLLSFGLEDVIYTAASDSEDFGPALTDDAIPPSGQETRPTAAYTELMDVLSRTTEKHAIESPASHSRLNSTRDFLVALILGQSEKSCPFSVICITRFPDPGSSLSLLV